MVSRLRNVLTLGVGWWTRTQNDCFARDRLWVGACCVRVRVIHRMLFFFFLPSTGSKLKALADTMTTPGDRHSVPYHNVVSDC